MKAPSAAVPAMRRAKLRAPTVSEHYVRRARLLTLLDAAADSSVTLVRAGAGSGKTTLAAGWMLESSAATAWASLDTTDIDASAFWTTLISALQTLSPGCGKRAMSILRRGGASAQAVVALSDDLEAAEARTSFLVVDDLHLVDQVDEITETFALLVEHLPGWLHLVLLSRRAVALPRERLLVQGRLGEIRFAELRFSVEEAGELLDQLAPGLTREEINTAAAQADGWAAGLRLAALAARAASARADPAVDPLVADGALIHDFVLHEVLAVEDHQLLQFLSEICVVVRVTPSLAEALTDRGDAAECLSRAEARGLFVSRLGEGGWFELHPLARGALAADMAVRSPDRLAELHARAARWFEAADEVAFALEHWLAAGRQRDALRLLAAEHANLYDSGREATVRRTVSAFDTDFVTADLESMIEFAWCHLLVDRRRFLELVEELSWWADRSTMDPTSAARVLMLQSMAATISGGWTEGGALARKAIKGFGESAWQDPLGRFAWNMVAREIAYSEQWEDGADDVRQARLALARDPRRRLAFEGTRALGQALAGWAVDALRLVAGIRHASSISEMSILRSELLVAEAVAARELGDRPRAFRLLEELAQAPAEAVLICHILAGVELVRAHIDAGEFDAAQEALGTTEALAESTQLRGSSRSWLPQVGTQLALATGRADLAGQLAAEVTDPFWAGISTARVAMAAGLRADARAALETAPPRCARHRVVLHLLTALSVEDREEAAKLATMAVEQASAAGILQTIAAEGPAALELIERSAWSVPARWLDRLRHAVSAAGLPVEPPGLVEPLTDRERDVLRFLPSRLTVREISDELYVSVNTLKFHLKVIYRKLGVSSRAEAAEVARHLAHVPRRP